MIEEAPLLIINCALIDQPLRIKINSEGPMDFLIYTISYVLSFKRNLDVVNRSKVDVRRINEYMIFTIGYIKNECIGRDSKNWISPNTRIAEAAERYDRGS